MKKGEGARKLLSALNNIDDRYVEEALEFYEKNKSKKKIINLSFFLKYATIAACLVLVVGASFIFKLNQKNDIESAAVASLYQEVNSLQEASEIVGFDIKAPDSVGEYTNLLVNVIDGNVIEVRYLSSDRQKTGFYIRKSRGTDDISGDSNVYSLNITESIAGKDVNLRGNKENWSVATWTEDGFSYALVAGDYVFSNEKLEYIIGNIK